VGIAVGTWIAGMQAVNANVVTQIIRKNRLI